MSIIILVLALAGWGVVHSWLASLAVKAWFAARFGQGLMRFFRLAYNLFAALSFLPILWLLFALPDRPFYRSPEPWSLLMLLGQALAFLLLVVGLMQTGPLSFLGLSQLVGQPEPALLVTSGLYRYVRHPLYTAGLLVIWLTPAVSLNLFTLFVGLTLYLFAGAWFEERKLLREFGSSYADYRRVTPMFIPGMLFRR